MANGKPYCCSTILTNNYFFYLFKITSRLTGCRNQRDSIQAGQQFQFFNSLPVIPSRTIKQKINYLSVAGSTMNCNSSSHHAEEGVCEAGYKNKKILFFIKKPAIGGKLKGRCPFPGLGNRVGRVENIPRLTVSNDIFW